MCVYVWRPGEKCTEFHRAGHVQVQCDVAPNALFEGGATLNRGRKKVDDVKFDSPADEEDKLVLRCRRRVRSKL